MAKCEGPSGSLVQGLPNLAGRPGSLSSCLADLACEPHWAGTSRDREWPSPGWRDES